MLQACAGDPPCLLVSTYPLMIDATVLIDPASLCSLHGTCPQLDAAVVLDEGLCMFACWGGNVPVVLRF